MAQDHERVLARRADGEGVDPRRERWAVDDDDRELANRLSSSRGSAELAMSSGLVVRRPPHGRRLNRSWDVGCRTSGASHLARKHLDQSRPSLGAEHFMQRAASRVGVDEQRAISGFRERERQVGRDERLAVALLGARDPQMSG